MKFGLGTGGLDEKFSKNFWEIFANSVIQKDYIHTALNYNNVEQYFSKVFSENLGKPKLIVKIEINKNPLKKLINIPKQINLILEKYKLNYIDTVQICNNPSSNKLNTFLIQAILKKFKKQKIINNFFIESFEPFSNNLNNTINDSFYDGYIFTLNCFQRGASNFFFHNILNSNKKIISISSLASCQSNFYFEKFSSEFRISLNEIILRNKLESINALHIAFLKSTNKVSIALFGSKNYKRIKIIKSLIENTKPLSTSDMNKVISLQEKFKSPILF